MTESASGSKPARPFLDFYAEHHVAPVNYRRDPAFIVRRKWLLATLGIPPALLRGADVMEFGPGTGDNASVLASYGPRRYVLVDGNPASLEALTSRFSAFVSHSGRGIEVIDADFRDLEIDERFDVVIAENCIPGQVGGESLVARMGRLVRPGGVLAITCVSPAGLLADLCRQLLRPALLEREGSFDGQVALGARLIELHLATLGQSTRSAADWVTDNVLHDWLPAEEPLFTPALATRALAPLGFDVLGSSPRIGQDERWFKHIGPGSEPYSNRFLAQFGYQIPALLDHRVGMGERVADPTDVEPLLNELVRLRHDIITANSYERLPEFLEYLTRLGSRLPSASVETVRAIEDFCAPKGMLAVAKGAPFPEWPHFSAWWGRGVVHLSFWRGPDTHRD